MSIFGHLVGQCRATGCLENETLIPRYQPDRRGVPPTRPLGTNQSVGKWEGMPHTTTTYIVNILYKELYENRWYIQTICNTHFTEVCNTNLGINYSAKCIHRNNGHRKTSFRSPASWLTAACWLNANIEVSRVITYFYHISGLQNNMSRGLR